MMEHSRDSYLHALLFKFSEMSQVKEIKYSA